MLVLGKNCGPPWMQRGTTCRRWEQPLPSGCRSNIQAILALVDLPLRVVLQLRDMPGLGRGLQASCTCREHRMAQPSSNWASCERDHRWSWWHIDLTAQCLRRLPLALLCRLPKTRLGRLAGIAVQAGRYKYTRPMGPMGVWILRVYPKTETNSKFGPENRPS